MGEAGSEFTEAGVWPWMIDWIGVICLKNLLFLKEMSPDPSILLHHSVGVPSGTLPRTPILTSLSSCCFTAACQWRGMANGLWKATGLASLSAKSFIGGESFIRGRGCCSQQLKAEFP